jgi:ribosomal protein S12 methylthiotransferase accessory factor
MIDGAGRATTTLWAKLVGDGSGPRRAADLWCRAVDPGETLERIDPLRGPAGITRVADVTGLDWLGVPVCQAVRPASRNISVSQGKGATLALARVSALMESLETYHAEKIPSPSLRASISDLGNALGYDPFTLPLMRAPLSDRRGDAGAFDLSGDGAGRFILGREQQIEWLEATDLSTGRATFVPRALCELDFVAEERLAVGRFLPSSNGLASGNTPAEALVHGLCEVVERDAVARAEASWLDPRASVAPGGSGPLNDATRALQSLVDRIQRGGARVHLFDRTGPVGVPCFEAFISVPGQRTFRGAGCHPVAAIAAARALTEAAQSRLAHIAGSRDDLWRASYRQSEGDFAWPQPMRDLEARPGLELRTFREAVAEIAARVQAVTGMPALAVDLTRPAFEIPVVFVLAPGLSSPAHGRSPSWYPRRRQAHPAQAQAAAARAPAGALPLLPVTGRRRRVCLFVGPSLAPDEVVARCRELPATVEVEIRPPAEQGDLFRLLDDPPEVVALIDGAFSQSPAILHKELLALVSSGVRVVGAASMGALRAAEMDRHGMLGEGQIYRWYRDGQVDADDEVAVLHGSADDGYRPVTEALVNWRARLQRAREREAVSEATTAAALAAAREMYFGSRTLPALLARVSARGISGVEVARLARALDPANGNLKRDDAVALLERLRCELSAEESSAPPGSIPTLGLQTKYSWRQARAYVGSQTEGFEVPDSLVLSFEKLLSFSFPRRRRDVLFRLLISEAATRHQVEVEPDERLQRRFLRMRRMKGAAELGQWLSARRLARQDLLCVLRERSLVRRWWASQRTPRARAELLAEIGAAHGSSARDIWVVPRMAPAIPWELPLIREAKLSGRFDRWRRVAVAGLETLALVEDANPSLAALLSVERLRRWVSTVWRVPAGSLAGAAVNRGFESDGELVDTAKLAYARSLRHLLAPVWSGRAFRAGQDGAGGRGVILASEGPAVSARGAT